MKKKKRLTALLSSMIKIGFLGFGGGSGLIPLMEKKLVREEKLVSEEEFEDAVVIASITPGALPVEIAGSVGAKTNGWLGAVLASSVMALPGAVMTILFLAVTFFSREKAVQQFSFLSVGITAYILCVITNYIKDSVHQKKQEGEQAKAVILMLFVFALTCGKNLYRILQLTQKPLFSFKTVDIFVVVFFWMLSVQKGISKKSYGIAVLLSLVYILDASRISLWDTLWVGRVCKVLMLVRCFGKSRHYIDLLFQKKEKINWSIYVAFLAFLGGTLFIAYLGTSKSALFVRNGLVSSLLSFGGGDAYLTVADSIFIQGKIIEESEFYMYLVPIVNVLPGSILCKCLTGMGYLIGYHATGNIAVGLMVAIAGFSCSVSASCGICFLIGDVYSRLSEVEAVRSFKAWVRVIVSGLMLTVALSLINQSVLIGRNITNNQFPVLCMGILYGMNQMLVRKKKDRMQGIWISIVAALLCCNLCCGK